MRNGIQKSPGFNKSIKKSGPLIIGVKGLDSGLLVLIIILILARYILLI